MRTSTTTAGILAVLALTLTACSSDGSDGKSEPAPATSSTTASASPTVDQAAARQECIDAWIELLEAGTASADNQPAVCEQVPGQSAAMYAEALRQRNDANRERMDECLEDPSCTDLPIP